MISGKIKFNLPLHLCLKMYPGNSWIHNREPWTVNDKMPVAVVIRIDTQSRLRCRKDFEWILNLNPTGKRRNLAEFFHRLVRNPRSLSVRCLLCLERDRNSLWPNFPPTKLNQLISGPSVKFLSLSPCILYDLDIQWLRIFFHWWSRAFDPPLFLWLSSSLDLRFWFVFDK